MKLLLTVVIFLSAYILSAQSGAFYVQEKTNSFPNNKLASQYSYQVIIDSTGKIISDDGQEKILGGINIIDASYAKIHWRNNNYKYRIDTLCDELMRFYTSIEFEPNKEKPDQPFPKSTQKPETSMSIVLDFWKRCPENDHSCIEPKNSPMNQHRVQSDSSTSIQKEGLQPERPHR